MFSTDNLKRGDVIRVRFDPTEGSEQSGERPALVLSPELINARAPIILVAPLTTRKTERVYPFEALIEPLEGGLHQRSKVLLLHMRGIDKSRIIGRYGTLSDEVISRVDSAIRIATGLIQI